MLRHLEAIIIISLVNYRYFTFAFTFARILCNFMGSAYEIVLNPSDIVQSPDCDFMVFHTIAAKNERTFRIVRCRWFYYRLTAWVFDSRWRHSKRSTLLPTDKTVFPYCQNMHRLEDCIIERRVTDPERPSGNEDEMIEQMMCKIVRMLNSNSSISCTFGWTRSRLLREC